MYSLTIEEIYLQFSAELAEIDEQNIFLIRLRQDQLCLTRGVLTLSGRNRRLCNRIIANAGLTAEIIDG